MDKKRFFGWLGLLVLFLAALPAGAGPAGRPTAATIAPNALEPVAVWSSDETDNTVSIAWGDWDGDGDLDMAVGNYDQSIRIYENTGSWLDATAAWSSEEGNVTDLAWGDWDNDGDLDLAVGNWGEPNRVYENTGGDLTLAWSSDESDYTWGLAWGDWDGDGDLDLAVGNYRQPNRVYENTAGNLTLAWSSAEEDDTLSLAWGDWDNDGDLDLAVGNDEQSNRVYENTAGDLTPAWSSAEEASTYSVAWGDWDGDGDLDLAVGNWRAPNRVYENTGGDLTLAWSSAESEDTWGLAWGDWDGDGDLDLAVGNGTFPVGQTNRVYENTGGDLALAWSSAESDATYDVAWADWNNDGDLDLAVGNYDQPNRVYENLAGPMTPAASWSSPLSDQAVGAAWGDYDGDGDLDLAVDTTNGQPTRVYENTGGSLDLAWSSTETDDSHDLAWGDWDGDGDLDLAVANGGPNGSPNRVYENTGGDLTLAWSSAESDDTWGLAWGDWDGDGDLDLAVANYSSQQNRVYENSGGDLSLAWSSTEEDASIAVAWGDWDNDGDLDLAVANYLYQQNRVYENTGVTLTLAWSSTEEDNSLDVAWGDWDGDGDLDLAVGNWGQPDRVYENTGGGLMPPWSTAEVDRTAGVAWGDWDGDGDLDLAAGNGTVMAGQPNRVYENLGSELDPVAVWTSAESDDTQAVAWGDWDNDGDLDLVAANWGQPLRVYENNRVAAPTMPNSAAHPFVYRPGSSADAFFYSSAEILTSMYVPILFRLYDAESDPVPRIAARYSTDGGGSWHTATITGTVTNLSASPEGSLHLIGWNALADGARGDNVTFRLISVLDDPTYAGFPIQRPYVSAVTPPFRLRPLAVALLPLRQLGIGPGGTTITHTLTLVNRTGRGGLLAVAYDSFRGWPVDGPNLVGPIPDLGFASFTVTTTVPAGPAGTLDIVTATAAALFNPATFNAQAHIFTFRGAPDVSLSIEKEAPPTVEAGSVFTYTLVAHNAGASPAGGVVITETLPAEVSFAWAGQDGVYSPTLGAVIWPDHILFSDRSLTVTVAVTASCVPSGTLIVNDDYAVAAEQAPDPVVGPAIATRVLYEAPQAAFSLAPSEVNLGEAVVFTNTSRYATAYLWDFGDGITSTLAEPMHTYIYEGTYTVTLIAFNACGSDQATAQVTATLFLQAGFQHNAPVCLGEAVIFTNTTAGMPPISYTWDFGDGITSTVEHPTHTYAAADFYMVSLRAVSPFGEGLAADMVDVLPLPAAGFTYTVDGLTVSFTNTSTAADTYLWDFGDGITGTEEYPVHTYASAGTYTVTLTASGVCGSDEATATITVSAEGVYRVFLPLLRKSY